MSEVAPRSWSLDYPSALVPSALMIPAQPLSVAPELLRFWDRTRVGWGNGCTPPLGNLRPRIPCRILLWANRFLG